MMDQVRAEMSQHFAQEFLNQMRDKCFEKCITRPGNSMSSGETSCVQRCFDRYEDATKAVAKGLSG
jgi:import inner membrane translocase subunit TIM13